MCKQHLAAIQASLEKEVFCFWLFAAVELTDGVKCWKQFIKCLGYLYIFLFIVVSIQYKINNERYQSGNLLYLATLLSITIAMPYPSLCTEWEGELTVDTELWLPVASLFREAKAMPYFFLTQLFWASTQRGVYIFMLILYYIFSSNISCRAQSSTTGNEKVSLTDPITEWAHLALTQAPMEPFSKAEQLLKSYRSKQTQRCRYWPLALVIYGCNTI